MIIHNFDYNIFLKTLITVKIISKNLSESLAIFIQIIIFDFF